MSDDRLVKKSLIGGDTGRERVSDGGGGNDGYEVGRVKPIGATSPTPTPSRERRNRFLPLSAGSGGKR